MICPPLSPCGPASTAPPIPNILYHDLFIRTSTKRALKIRTLWSSEIQFGAPLSRSSRVVDSPRPVIFSLEERCTTNHCDESMTNDVSSTGQGQLFVYPPVGQLMKRRRELTRHDRYIDQGSWLDGFFYLSQCEYVVGPMCVS